MTKQAVAVVALSALPTHRRSIAQGLIQLVEPHRRVGDCRPLVSCAVTGRGTDVIINGINHELHKRVNQNHSILRGVLKGCAEQNALGSFAAQGLRYADITNIFLYVSRTDGPCMEGPRYVPCPECWNLLSIVSDAAAAEHGPEHRPHLYVLVPSQCYLPSLVGAVETKQRRLLGPHVCLVPYL